MEYFQLFVNTFFAYLNDLWFSLALGFLLSGIFSEFVPTSLVEKHLGDNKLRGIFLSAFVGTLLPVCCFGSLPIAMTMRRKGARLGPILAFLVATPATSISALFITGRLLGLNFAVYIFFAVIIMALIVGVVGNFLRVPAPPKLTTGPSDSAKTCCDAPMPSKKLSDKIKRALKYAFITLPREIGGELLLAVALASFIITFDPIQTFIHQYLQGMTGYLAIIISGLVTYVCCTASVPLADALIKSGLTPGHAMTFLLVGPITSYGTILVMFQEFGGRVLAVYLILISFLSFLLGVLYNKFHF